MFQTGSESYKNIEKFTELKNSENCQDIVNGFVFFLLIFR